MSARQRVATLLPVVADLVVPTFGYSLLHAAGLSDTWALTAAGSCAALVTVVNSLWRRSLDLLGALVVAELTASVIVAAVVHDPRLILARVSRRLTPSRDSLPSVS